MVTFFIFCHRVVKSNNNNYFSLEVAHDTDLVHTTMATQNNTTAQNTTKVGLVILSVLIPIIGYIAFFVNKEEAPETARNYLISAVVGSVVAVLLML